MKKEGKSVKRGRRVTNHETEQQHFNNTRICMLEWRRCRRQHACEYFSYFPGGQAVLFTFRISTSRSACFELFDNNYEGM